jgi:hypothetical protein
MRTLSFWMLLATAFFLFAARAQGVSITYGNDNRPTLFEDIDLDGTLYDVTVTWGSIYDAVYSAGGPLFLGDLTAATTARSALSQALVADAYGAATTVSYLNVPYAWGDHRTITSRGIYLYSSPTYFLDVSTYHDVSYPTVGFTVWSAVPEPSTALLLALGLAGIAARRRRMH